jgi:chromosome segregation protein
VRRAQLEGELAAERRQAARVERERSERLGRRERLQAQYACDSALLPLAERLAAALQSTQERLTERLAKLEAELAGDRAAGEEMAAELRACAAAEADIQTRLRGAGELVTSAEVAAQRLRDQAGEAELELRDLAERLGLASSEDDAPDAQEDSTPRGAAAIGRADADGEELGEEERQALIARLERLARRREQLGPVNPLAQQEYSEAVAHVEQMEGRRGDLETAMRELRALIGETDRQIHDSFEATFAAAARNFAELVGDVFPGGSGRLRLVSDERLPRAVLGGQPLPEKGSGAARPQAVVGGSAAELDAAGDDADEAAAEAEVELAERDEDELLGVEIEITPAGKSTKRLSLLSGGEKSMTALAFLFAVFLARPCPFYILDEVEAALDDLNLDRFLALLRRYSQQAQFIVITHQKRTMEAADWLYGVSMGGDGVSKVISRRLPAEQQQAPEVAEVA